MKTLSLLAAILTTTTSCTLAADAPAKPGFAVVELFTSEGCSSCPPADRALAKLVTESRKDGTAVYPLAFHVDYWNRLGWTDPFSSAAASDRQNAYASAFHADQVYTPQMVVNGTTQFVGSNKAKADEAIKTDLAESRAHTIKIEVADKDGVVSVKFATDDTDKDAKVIVAAVQRGLSSKVTKGENGGNTLDHENVVRAFETKAAAAGSVELKLPTDFDTGKGSIVAFVQDSKTMKIVAATGQDFSK